MNENEATNYMVKPWTKWKIQFKVEWILMKPWTDQFHFNYRPHSQRLLSGSNFDWRVLFQAQIFMLEKNLCNLFFSIICSFFDSYQKLSYQVLSLLSVRWFRPSRLWTWGGNGRAVWKNKQKKTFFSNNTPTKFKMLTLNTVKNEKCSFLSVRNEFFVMLKQEEITFSVFGYQLLLVFPMKNESFCKCWDSNEPSKLLVRHRKKTGTVLQLCFRILYFNC